VYLPYIEFQSIKIMNLASKLHISQCYEVKCETVINSKNLFILYWAILLIFHAIFNLG